MKHFKFKLIFHFFLPYWLILGLVNIVSAKVDVSMLFVRLSDAIVEVKKGEVESAKANLIALQQDFANIPQYHSQAGITVTENLSDAINDVRLERIESVAKALYLFEKEQNPIDYTQKRQQFAKRVMPAYFQLEQAVVSEDLLQLQKSYKHFNTIWTLNEAIVRETSIGYYGQIETAMALLRVAMLSEPAQFSQIRTQQQNLKQALADFNQGKVFEPQATQADSPQNLLQGIQLLTQSYQAFLDNQIAQGQEKITLFIQQWPIFEGEVSTRNMDLYTRIESELPLIMAKGNNTENMERFQNLIEDLSHLDLSGSYGIFDAMLILLREGIEALLVIMALLTTISMTKQPRAKYWIYAGAGLGVFASVMGAIALQLIFPSISAGTNREILEGVVGIVAVMMMIFIGAWLHSKSSINGWNAFINKHINKALATGSLVSMFSLSFLSVFREGAETVLFYVGMLPLIDLADLIVGTSIALLLLLLIGFVMLKSSTRLPVHYLFKLMTLLIYALGFKILGVSIYALQLTKILPTHLVENVPHLTMIGFYSTWEGIGSQMLYLMLVFLSTKLFKQD